LWQFFAPGLERGSHLKIRACNLYSDGTFEQTGLTLTTDDLEATVDIRAVALVAG
jgi:hypothetical protein